MQETLTHSGRSRPTGSFGGLPICRYLLVGLTALMLSACVSSDVAVIDRASREEIRSIHVAEVDVKLHTVRPNPLLKAELDDELKRTLPTCAKGSVPHRMEVTITEFEDQDVGKAIFIGDEIELEGRVQLFDIATDEEIGEYFVSRSFFWGGFIGAAMMSDAEDSLSEGFADSICEEVFGVKKVRNKTQRAN